MDLISLRSSQGAFRIFELSWKFKKRGPGNSIVLWNSSSKFLAQMILCRYFTNLTDKIFDYLKLLKALAISLWIQLVWWSSQGAFRIMNYFESSRRVAQMRRVMLSQNCIDTIKGRARLMQENEDGSVSKFIADSDLCSFVFRSAYINYIC